MTRRPSVVIVGGGISGLAAAWELSGGGNGPRDDAPRIEIVETSPHVGGVLHATTFADRILDCGPDGFLARRPEVRELAEEVGLESDLVPIAASGAWMYLRGRLEALPTGSVMGVPTSRAMLRSLHGLTWRAHYAAWRDTVAPRRFDVSGDVAIGPIVRTKLGDEIADTIVEPMVGGIQAGRIDSLSAESVFPALVAAAKKGGSLMRALAPASANSGTGAADSSPLFNTLREGVGSLCTALERQLLARDVVISTNTTVASLRRGTAGEYRWEVDTAYATVPASFVVVAASASAAAQLLGDFDDDLAALATIDAATCAMVTFSLPRESVSLPPTGTGVLVPLGTPFANDSLMVTAVSFLDRKWPHLVRDNSVLIRAHVGRIDDTRSVGLTDADLVNRLRSELAAIFGSWTNEGDVMVTRFPDGLAQYHVGHADLVDRARSGASRLRVALAGSSYDGVGIPASVGSGRRAARSVVFD